MERERGRTSSGESSRARPERRVEERRWVVYLPGKSGQDGEGRDEGKRKGRGRQT